MARKITDDEILTVSHLAKIANYELKFPSELLVMPMNDGGMGSFQIFETADDLNVKRQFGKQISEFQFIDTDNIPVLVSLNTDDRGKLFEVDIFKADFQPVITFQIPI